MDLSLIKELYDKGLCTFAESFDTWQEAVEYAAIPLIEKGYIDHGYVDGIFQNVAKNGLYIFIAPHICMPHSGVYESVHKECIGFMKCNKPVIADENEPDMGAELFFTIAAEAEGEHIKAIQRLAMLLSDEDIVNALLEVHNEDDLIRLLNDNPQQLSK